MKLKNKYLISLLASVWAFFFLFPGISFAVDFSITKVNIEAFLKENGQVDVVETHAYSFEGDFNGITRELVPKEGSSFVEVTASEDGKNLKVEKEDDLYKIHRKGEDETITVEISYTIKNGVDVYADVAEFYWPFFDDRNESTYENMSIIIHPPVATSEVIAFGYDEAFETENIQQDGSVLFQLGKVPSDNNGDIRVAYDAALFPSATVAANKPMKNEILTAQQEIYEKLAAKAKMQETLSTVSFVVVPAFALIILLLMVGASMRARNRKLEVERKVQQSFFIPKESMSIPATIYFMKKQIPAETMAAALLDLVRKGYIAKTGDTQFKLERKPSEILKHEKILVEFLFDEIGDGENFSFEDLEKYTKNKKNHEKYHSQMMKWQQAVVNEVKESNLYEKNGKLRWTLGLISILQLAFAFFVLAYELFGWFFALLVLVFVYFVFAIAYKPKTREGLMISKEWESMKERLHMISTKDWEALTDDEQMRSYLYGLGTNDNDIQNKNEELIQSFKRPSNTHYNTSGWDASAVNVNTMLLVGPLASTNFHTAQKTTQSTVNSSSSSSSSGGGVGGGGGGSGAF